MRVVKCSRLKAVAISVRNRTAANQLMSATLPYQRTSTDRRQFMLAFREKRLEVYKVIFKQIVVQIGLMNFVYICFRS